MVNKNIYYLIGGVALLGMGYLLWNKSNKDTQVLSEMDSEGNVYESNDNITRSSETLVTASTPTPTPTPAPVIKKLTPQELESKLSSGCGKKPKLKKNKTLWNNCRNDMKDSLKSQGLISFDGSYSFEGSNDFYSRFDSNFDLNM